MIDEDVKPELGAKVDTEEQNNDKILKEASNIDGLVATNVVEDVEQSELPYVHGVVKIGQWLWKADYKCLKWS